MITTVVAENNFGDTMSDGLAGPMGLLIIVLLAIATALLIRSMNRHLRRIPERFPSQPAAAGAATPPVDPATRHVDPAAPPVDPAAVPGRPGAGSADRVPGGQATTGGLVDGPTGEE
jgi:hypothetical protein